MDIRVRAYEIQQHRTTTQTKLHIRNATDYMTTGCIVFPFTTE